MYSIKLANGKTLKDLELNGNNFISATVLDGSTFEGGLGTVEISDGEKTKTCADMKLISNRVDGGKSWFILGEKTQQEKAEEQMQAENILLRAQVAAASERQEFLEDCIAEMAAQVYGA